MTMKKALIKVRVNGKELVSADLIELMQIQAGDVDIAGGIVEVNITNGKDQAKFFINVDEVAVDEVAVG